MIHYYSNLLYIYKYKTISNPIISIIDIVWYDGYERITIINN